MKMLFVVIDENKIEEEKVKEIEGKIAEVVTNAGGRTAVNHRHPFYLNRRGHRRISVLATDLVRTSVGGIYLGNMGVTDLNNEDMPEDLEE